MTDQVTSSPPADRRDASAAWGLAALFVLLAFWKSYSLTSNNFRVQEEWNAATYLLASAQDLFAWSVLAVAWGWWLRRFARSGLATLIGLAVLWLVFQAVDARMKVRFLHPLSIDWIRFALREIDTIGPDYTLFTGQGYWLAALGTIAMLIVAFALPLAFPFRGFVRGCARLAFDTRTWSGVVTVALGVTVFLLPALPYGLHRNFVVSSILPIDRTPSGVRNHETIPSEEPLRASSKADFGHATDPSIACAKGWNVVMYVLESTALEQTSLGRSGADTTPFLRELVDVGGAVVPCYAQIANSAKATFSLYSGLYASNTMEVLECEIEDTPGLARTLGEHGYYSAFVSPQTLLYQGQRTMLRRMGFDEVVGFLDLRAIAAERGLPFEESGPAANDDRLVLQWNHEHLAARQPFFLSYYTQSTHFSYRFPGQTPGPDEERHARALRYADRVLREIVELHKRLGVYERTLYVITSDHGEDFVDGAFAPRNSSLSENGHRTPLVLFAPGVDLRQHALPTARQVDVPPTILDLLGLAPEGLPLQGRSLFDGHGERPVFLGSYGAERVFGLIENGRKWGFDAGSRTLRHLDHAIDPLGRNWRSVDIRDEPEIVRRLEQFALHNEACLRDLAARGATK